MSRYIDENVDDSATGAPAPGSEPWILDGPEDGLEQPPAPAAPAAPGAAPATPPPAVAPSGQGYELRSSTGLVFRGDTPEAALAQAEAYQRRREAEVAQPPRDYQRRDATPPPAAAPTAPAWSDESFYKTFGTNPRAAMDAWFNQYFQEKFGQTPEALLGRVDPSYSVAVQVSDRIAVADFLQQNPDFPASNESADLLVKRLDRDGVEVTTWNLEVAYRQLVREQLLAPVPQGGPPTTPAPQIPPVAVPPRRGATPPPMPGDGAGRGSGFDPNRRLSIEEFENLSTADMRRYMQSPAYRGGGS